MSPSPTRPYALPLLSPADAQAKGRAFYQEMESRRSCRDFSSKPVPRSLIELAIHTAGQAPSGANLQPWTFVAVSNPDLKVKIREAAEAEERENYQGRMSEAWLEDLAHLGTDANKPHITEAPWVIVVFRHTRRPDGGKTYYAQESAGLAVGLLLASLHLMGLATLTHTPSPMAFLRDLLGRPTSEKPFLLIPVGYPTADCQVPDISRKPLSDIAIFKE